MVNIPPEALDTAVGRLNQAGVFGDEERKFPSLPALMRDFTGFETTLRSRGYIGGALEIGELDQPKDGVNFLIFDKAKLGDVRSAAVAWEQEYRARWQRIVEERVRNWLRRLVNLQTTMQGWLPAGMQIVARPPTKMHEDLMIKFGVPPADMPTFEVHAGANRIMRVQPKGLWIIGANGRVDLITPTASYILVDKSDRLSGASDWHYYTSANRRQSTRLDDAQFVSLLK
jgi:hypothetical protein